MRTFITIAIIVILGAALGWGAWHYGWLNRFTSGNKTPTTQTNNPQPATTTTYASSTMGVSISYPNTYTVNGSYAYDQFGEKKLIHGVSFTIPASMATGTNLSSDTRVTVEQLPRAKSCTGDIFILDNVKAVQMQIGSTTYSVASTTGAGAGNRYEETIYAISDSKPCTAVRYFVHYGAIENYPTGTVQAFDRATLLSQFDTIRKSLVLGAPTSSI